MTTALEMVGAFLLAATLLTAAMFLAALLLGRLIAGDDGQRAVEENASDEPVLEPHRSEHRRRSAARSAHCPILRRRETGARRVLLAAGDAGGVFTFPTSADARTFTAAGAAMA